MAGDPENIATLLDATPPCVSVFVALERRGVAGEHDRHRVALLLHDAEGALRAWGLRPREAAAIVVPARRWLDEAPWPAAWAGLGLYLAPGLSRRVGLRSPVSDRLVIGDRFLVGPLIREIGGRGRFWLLALSRSNPRLFRGDTDGLRPVGPSLPTLEAVVGSDEAEASLQYHSEGGGSARATVTYHGQGARKDAAQDQVARWIAAVADRVDGVLSHQAAPLVLAGVREQLAAFRRASDHPNILATEVVGSPDRTPPSVLHARAWPVVAAHASQVRESDLSRYRERAGTGLTAAAPDDVLRLAEEGHVAVLFAPADPAVEDEVAVDRAIVAVWRTGGTVHVLDEPVPGVGSLAAILRYASTVPEKDPVQSG